MTKVSRRGLLAALGAIGLAGTAGCNAFSNESTTDAPTDTAAGTDRGSTTPTATLSPGTTDSAASGETSKTVTGSRSTASEGTKTATQTPSPTPAPTETPTPTPTPTPTGPWRFAADDSDGGDNFGGAVALSGDTALVGAKLDRDPNGGQAGSAYVFTRSGGEWTQGAKLVPEDGDAGDRFGASVALAGDTALVGARSDEDPNGSGAGSAYVFTRSGGEWSQESKLVPEDGDGGDSFGASVALSGDTAVVGAWQDEDPNGDGAGSAYVFTRSSGGWTQAAKLVDEGGGSSAGFGRSVAVESDRVLVGAPTARGPDRSGGGAVCAFTRSGGEWTQEETFAPDDASFGDRFGVSVALSGETAFVGAWADADPNGPWAGSAYVFTRSDGAWSQQTKLVPEDGAANDWFGSSVALAGDTALVGAHGTDHRGTNTGSTYAFGRTDDGWTLRTTLDTDSVNRQDRFGASVALTGETETETKTALVGAPQEENAEGRNAGAAHVFSLS